MTPRQLLQAARQRAAAGTTASWGRVAAFLGRMALEHAVRQRLIRAHPVTREAAFTAQLLALEAEIDPALARQAHYTWSALSEATHYAGYDLPPTAGELRRWLDTVETILAACEA